MTRFWSVASVVLVLVGGSRSAARADDIRLGTATLRSLAPYWVTMSSDGTQLAYRSGTDTLTIAEPKTGKTIRTLTIREKEIGEQCFFSQNGTQIIFCGMQHFRLVDATTGKVLHTFGPTDRFDVDRRELVWSGDGKLLLWMTSGFVRTTPFRLWDAAAGKDLGEIAVVQDNGQRFGAISGDAKVMVTGALGHHRKSDTEARWEEYVELWDPATRKMKGRLHIGDGVQPYRAALSREGQYLVVLAGGKSALQLWDTTTQKRVAVLEERVGAVEAWFTFSPDGKRLAVQTDRGGCALYETATGKKVVEKRATGNFGAGIGFTADGEVLACNVDNSQISVLSLTAKDAPAPVKTGGHTLPVLAVHFTSDGKSILTAGQDCRILRWDAKTGALVETVFQKDFFPGSTWNSPSRFTPDGKYFIAGSQLWVIDLEKKRDLGRLPNAPNFYVKWSAVDLSEDGKTIYARGTAQEKTATGYKLNAVAYVGSWDLATVGLKSEFNGGKAPDELFDSKYGKEKLMPWPGRAAEQPEIALGAGARDPWASPFNASALTVGKQVKVTDRTSKKVLFDKLLSLSDPNGGIGICTSPDGKRLAVPLIDSTVLVLDLKAPPE